PSAAASAAAGASAGPRGRSSGALRASAASGGRSCGAGSFFFEHPPMPTPKASSPILATRPPTRILDAIEAVHEGYKQKCRLDEGGVSPREVDQIHSAGRSRGDEGGEALKHDDLSIMMIGLFD